MLEQIERRFVRQMDGEREARLEVLTGRLAELEAQLDQGQRALEYSRREHAGARCAGVLLPRGLRAPLEELRNRRGVPSMRRAVLTVLFAGLSVLEPDLAASAERA